MVMWLKDGGLGPKPMREDKAAAGRGFRTGLGEAGGGRGDLTALGKEAAGQWAAWGAQISEWA